MATKDAWDLMHRVVMITVPVILSGVVGTQVFIFTNIAALREWRAGVLSSMATKSEVRELEDKQNQKFEDVRTELFEIKRLILELKNASR